jgi:hypothetical protein
MKMFTYISDWSNNNGSRGLPPNAEHSTLPFLLKFLYFYLKGEFQVQALIEP